jgi:hypothetical protein
MADNMKTKKEPYLSGISTEPKGLALIGKAAAGLADIRSNVAAKQHEADINRRKSFGLPETSTPATTMPIPQNKPIIQVPTQVAGLPKTTETPYGTAKRIYNETVNRPVKTLGTPREEYVPATGGTNKPYGYPEEGQVYTNEDLNQPMTGGGFGYVSKGLPEAKVNIEDYIRETITKMQDRGDKLALQIEAGFAKGKRLTAASEELQGIQSAIPILTGQLAGADVGIRGKEAEIGKTEAEQAKIERETSGLPRTPEEALKFGETIAGAKGMGLAESRYLEYTKTKNAILKGTYIDAEAKQEALNGLYAAYPEYAGMNERSESGSGGKTRQEGEEWIENGERFKYEGGKIKRWRG